MNKIADKKVEILTDEIVIDGRDVERAAQLAKERQATAEAKKQQPK